MMMWGGGGLFMGLLFLLIIGFAIYFINQKSSLQQLILAPGCLE